MKVSIIIPYKEDRGYLSDALISIDKQSYRNIEVIPIQSDNYVGYNINRGVEKSTGDLICFLSDDDKLPMNSIEYRVNAFKRHDYDFLHTRAVCLFPGGLTKPYNLTNRDVTLASCLENNGIHGGTVMYKTELLKENPFKEDLWTAEEWELNLRLLSKGYRLGYLNRVCYIYRRHSQQKSIGNISSEYQNKRQKIKDEIRHLYSPNSTGSPKR